MTLIDLGPILAEPVSLVDAKTWCRIDRNDEDALILGLTRAARETVEIETRLVLVRRMFRLSLDPVPPGGWIEIPRRPLVAVRALTAYDAAGAPTEFGDEDFVVERALGVEAIRLSPQVRAIAVNGIEIEFEAGFAADAVPEALKLAIRRIVSASYELRAAVPLAQQPGLVPPAARALLAPYRAVRV